MNEMTGEHVREVLRLMSWDDRRSVLVVVNDHVKDAAPTRPFDRIIEAIRNDILVAEDEERRLAEEIDG